MSDSLHAAEMAQKDLQVHQLELRWQSAVKSLTNALEERAGIYQQLDKLGYRLYPDGSIKEISNE